MNEELPITEYDKNIQTQDLQIIKALLPYLAPSLKKQMILYIQYLETYQAMNYYQNCNDSLAAMELENPKDKLAAMLNAIKPYFNEEDQSYLNNILNMFYLSQR